MDIGLYRCRQEMCKLSLAQKFAVKQFDIWLTLFLQVRTCTAKPEMIVTGSAGGAGGDGKVAGAFTATAEQDFDELGIGQLPHITD